MIKRERRPTAPGEILRAHYLKPRHVSISKLAAAVGCSRKHMSQIVNGGARIEPMMAARVARVLGTTAQFWCNLQAAVDAYDAEREAKTWRPAAVYGEGLAQAD